MMRWLWQHLVTGQPWVIVVWMAFLGINIYRDKPVGIAIDVVLIALNLYSFDYQRRRAAGEVMPLDRS